MTVDTWQSQGVASARSGYAHPMTSGTGPVAVFAPTTQMSVTLECTAGVEELHVHAAGQGFWVARMLTVLGHEPLLCTPVGGETGTALRALLGDLPTDGLVPSPWPNGSYVHDRRSGERVVVAHLTTPPLDRHTVDELVSATLACALSAGTVVVTGTNLDGNVEPTTFRRLCRDLRGAGVTVIADLSGAELRAALDGGVDLVKISHEELATDGWSSGTAAAEVLDGIRAIRDAGARDVVVSCATDGVLAALGTRWLQVAAPTMTVIDHRGAGDSMTAALTHGHVAGLDPIETITLATAAAALNVTRHGLASGHRGAIDQLSRLVSVTDLDG